MRVVETAPIALGSVTIIYTIAESTAIVPYDA